MNLPTLKTIEGNFLKELSRAHEGKASSIPFIVHRIPAAPLARTGEIFQVISIGGSVARIAHVRRNALDRTEVIQVRKENSPQFLAKAYFLEFMRERISPKVKVVALNFAYPLKPVLRKGRLDGILIRGSKENTFEGLVGEEVGREIEEYVAQKLNRNIKVAVANDIACLLLAGLNVFSWRKLVAAIVGTGINAAFFLDRNKFVNLESNSFDKFTASPEGKIVDRESANPGVALFEKEITGAYLYKHFNLILKKRKSSHPQISSTHELKKIALENEGEIGEIARALLARSASLVAAQLAAIALFKKRNITVVAEGSFFWDEEIYSNYVDEYVKKLVPEYEVSFVRVKNSPIIGGSRLVC